MLQTRIHKFDLATDERDHPFVAEYVRGLTKKYRSVAFIGADTDLTLPDQGLLFVAAAKSEQDEKVHSGCIANVGLQIGTANAPYFDRLIDLTQIDFAAIAVAQTEEIANALKATCEGTVPLIELVRFFHGTPQTSELNSVNRAEFNTLIDTGNLEGKLLMREVFEQLSEGTRYPFLALTRDIRGRPNAVVFRHWRQMLSGIRHCGMIKVDPAWVTPYGREMYADAFKQGSHLIYAV